MSDEVWTREQPADPPGQFVDLPGGRVHVVVDGNLQRPCLVFVHGIPGSVRDARYLGPALARRGYACVRIDMPGFGQTARDVMPSPQARARAELVHHVAARLGVSRYAVAGHSIGGAVALAAAAIAPAHVEALVLLNAVGVVRHRGLVFPTAVHQALSRAARLPVGPWMAAHASRLYQERGIKSPTPIDAETLAHHLAILADLDFVAQRRRARAVQCPVLVFNTLDDPFLQPEVGQSMVTALTHAPWVTHLTTPEGGHHGQRFAASPVADWLTDTWQLLGPSRLDPHQASERSGP
jgi:pimeloyl-ACP methyl ester carboxylesterase